MAIVIGGLFTGGIALLLERSIIRILFGIILLSHAVNLLIFTIGRLRRDAIPMISPGATVAAGAADPLPQALILTAIVIGFGLQIFTIVLIWRTWQLLGSDDEEAMASSDHGQ